ncbi:MAG TPA: S8 family serine peptidase, partial [Solirubrobacteraceae bacterium]|nr:S8 family serine peptidase [Solirubrobacteraceae bacterium]
MTKLSLPVVRWGIFLSALWTLAVLLSFTPQASANQLLAPVVVLEDAGAGNGPEHAVANLGGSVDREIPLVSGFTARVPRSALETLRDTPGVRSVNADRRFKLRSTEDAPVTPATTLGAVNGAIRAGTVRAGRTDVALVDSGISPVGSLAGRVVNGPDLSEDAQYPSLRNVDAFGHGTHLAGVIAGVAPGARLVNVKVADSDGATSLGRLLAGIDWVVRHGDDGDLDVRVVNLAFGAETEGSYRDDPLAFAVERAWQKGVVVVAAAGNGGPDSTSLDTPAHDPYVIAVGASDSNGTTELDDDAVAAFSSRGSASRGPDVIAPGVAIVSERVIGGFLDEAFPDARIGETGFRGSGTSQAAAAVSGAAAVLVGARPALDPDDVKALLRSGARPLANTDASLQGAGVVDIAASAAMPEPRNARQRFQNARLGGWLRQAPRNQYAVENLKSNRWSSNRWSSNRWSSNRWSSNRWSSNRWSSNRWSSNRWSSNRWS